MCIRAFEELLDRWGLLIGTISAALAHAARGDWRQTTFALGVADSLGERIGGHPFPAVQAVIDAIAAKAAAELGSSALLRAKRAGQSAAATLSPPPWGSPQELAPPYTQQQELPLTRREHEVTELILGGLTNRQIAERLFIAQRTIDIHVGPNPGQAWLQ